MPSTSNSVFDDEEMALQNGGVKDGTISTKRQKEEEEWARYWLDERLEVNPIMGVSYCIYTFQFMMMTLDLFMDTQVYPQWHYSIAITELVVSTILAAYQFLRLRAVRLYNNNPNTSGDDLQQQIGRSSKRWCSCLLLVSGSIQLVLVAVAAYSLYIYSRAAKWTLFEVSLVWGIFNPYTYGAVETFRNIVQEQEEEKERAKNPTDEVKDEKKGEKKKDKKKKKKKKKRSSPLAAASSVFRRHFMRTPVLFFSATLLAVAKAILIAYMGMIINEITQAVTSVDTTTEEIQLLEYKLVGVWLASGAARVLFDWFGAKMYTHLECWLRSTIFEKAVASASAGDAEAGDSTISLGDYQARYSSDVAGVVQFYVTLLKGVLVNVLLLVANFALLVVMDWRVATTTLGFAVIAVMSGPTDLAGQSASTVQELAADGLSLLGDIENNLKKGKDGSSGKDAVLAQHETEVMIPLRANLFGRSFFSSSINTFVNFFSSFLTVVVVITMARDVYEGRIDSSAFLGIYYVFTQVQDPALQISGVIKKAIAKTASLDRIEAVIFDTDNNDNNDNKSPAAVVQPPAAPEEGNNDATNDGSTSKNILKYNDNQDNNNNESVPPDYPDPKATSLLTGGGATPTTTTRDDANNQISEQNNIPHQ